MRASAKAVRGNESTEVEGSSMRTGAGSVKGEATSRWLERSAVSYEGSRVSAPEQ